MNQKTKLNKIEKILLKRTLKKYKQQFELVKHHAQDRTKIEQAILSFQDEIDITHDDGTPLTLQNIHNMPTEELIQTFEDILNIAEKQL